MTAVELYLAATLATGTIWIFVPGPIGSRALVVFCALVRRPEGHAGNDGNGEPL